MPRVVSDTGPINYLIVIGHVYILPELFERVLVPGTVQRELQSAKSPTAVRRWVQAPPPWLAIEDMPDVPPDDSLRGIDIGEQAAIQLAKLRGLGLLMDDRKGVRAALRNELQVVGTLGLLRTAADRGLLDLEQAIRRLQRTNFRVRPSLLADVLARSPS